MTTTIETTDPEPDTLEPDAPGTEPDWTTKTLMRALDELMKAQRTELEDIDDYTADIFDRDVPLRDRVAHLVAEHAQMRAAAFADAYDELTGLVREAGPRLELTWPHKDEFLLVPKDDDGRPVWVPRDHPAAHEVRLTSPVAAVGGVGADPYADDTVFVGDSLDALRVMCEVPEYAERYRGKVKLVYIDPPFNTGQTFTHYDDWMEHSVWLSFMRERLLLIRELLAPDGSVWVHLDDAEVHRMRCLMDEVFGAQNFIADITWQKKYKPGNSLGIHATTNPVLVYGRQAGWRRSRGVPPSERQQAGYKNPDDDPRGAWRLTHSGVRVYLDDLLVRGAMPTTFWPYDETGHGEEATRESKRLTCGEPFSTPKPERLLERVLTIASNPGDLVVDCFAGSGTTAAVAHKMGRRWATVELSPATVADFVVPRLTKVVEGTDPGGITEAVGWTGRGGFRVVKVEPSLYEVGPGGL